VDLSVVQGDHFRSSTQFAFTQNESNSERGWSRVAFNTGFNYDSNNWEFDAGYQYVGRGVDLSAIGFEPEADRHSADASITWKPFLNRRGIRQIFFEINQDIALDTGGLTQDSGSDADLRVQFQNFWSARVRYSYDLVRFHDFGAANCPPPFACSPAFGRFAPTRIYIIPRVRLFFDTNENRPFFLGYQFTTQKTAQFRENFYGRSQTHFLGLTARMFGRTRVQLSGTFIREFLLDRTPFQNRRLIIARVNHQFTPKLRARLLAQYSNDRLRENFSVNSIVAYDFTARSAAIVGYNYQRTAPGQPSNLGNEFFVKLSYLFHF
jgi:hypothetical protein